MAYSSNSWFSYRSRVGWEGRQIYTKRTLNQWNRLCELIKFEWINFTNCSLINASNKFCLNSAVTRLGYFALWNFSFFGNSFFLSTIWKLSTALNLFRFFHRIQENQINLDVRNKITFAPTVNRLWIAQYRIYLASY